MKKVLALLALIVCFSGLSLKAHENEAPKICKVDTFSKGRLLLRNPANNTVYWEECVTYSLFIDDTLIEQERTCKDHSSLGEKFERHAKKLEADDKCTYLD